MKTFKIVSKNLLLTTFCVCILLLVILTVVFLWGELSGIQFESKVNHDKLSSYFTCVGFIVGGCSIVGLYLQIYKSEEDKHDFYKPLLLPKQAIITTRGKFGNESPAKPPFVNVSTNHSVCFVMLNGSVPVQNVGMGLAKRASFKWEYSQDELLNFVKYRHESAGNEKEKTALREVLEYLSRPVRRGDVEFEVQIIDKNEIIKVFPPFHYILSMLDASEYICIPHYSAKTPELVLTVKYNGFFDREIVQKFSVRIIPKIDFDSQGVSCEYFQMDFKLL